MTLESRPEGSVVTALELGWPKWPDAHEGCAQVTAADARLPAFAGDQPLRLQVELACTSERWTQLP